MSPSDETWTAFERLADALALEILQAEEAEILACDEGQGARVRADAVRQTVRRGVAASLAQDGPFRDRLREPVLRLLREETP